MARARNIKPGFFTNDALGELDPIARLLFIGLWTISDRAGRLEDRIKKIKATVLPYDNCNIDKQLDALEKSGFIVRYKAGTRSYIQIVNFDKHQNPHKNEPSSTIPAPDSPHIAPVKIANNRESSIQNSDALSERSNPNPADSVSLNPDTGYEEASQDSDRGGEGSDPPPRTRAHVSASMPAREGEMAHG